MVLLVYLQPDRLGGRESEPPTLTEEAKTMKSLESNCCGLWKVLEKYHPNAKGMGETMKYLAWCPKTGFEGRKLVAEAFAAAKKCADAEEAGADYSEREPLYEEANNKAEKAFLYAGCLGESACPMAIHRKGKSKNVYHVFCGFDPQSIKGPAIE